MEDGGFLAGALVGVALMWGYHAWHKPPQAVRNVQEQFPGSEILVKLGSGQVALIHGFLDDYAVCAMLRERLERDGGEYGCLPSEVAQKLP